MAQNHGSTGSLQLPPPRPAGLAAGLEEVARCEALLRALSGLLKPGEQAEDVASQAWEAVTRGLKLLHAAAAAPKVEEDEVDSLLPAQLPPVAASQRYSAEAKVEGPGMSSRQRKAEGAVGGAEKKAGHRRRSHPYSYKEITSMTLEDGHTWRKYGQKDIQNSSEPRSYFRCTYKKSRGCQAQRQAQKLEDGSGLYQITYFSEHTCDLPAAGAHHRKDQQGQQKIPPGTHLISFTAEKARAAVTPLPASVPVPCKKEEPATMPSDPVEVVMTGNDKAKPDVAAGSASLPPIYPGFYCGGADQKGVASPGHSSVASGLSHEDVMYMDGLDLTSLITLDYIEDFSSFSCSSF